MLPALAELRHGRRYVGVEDLEALAPPGLAEYLFSPMRLYALVEADPEAVDVYVCEEIARRALEDCLRDEPDWSGVLRIEAIDAPQPPTVSLN